MGVTKKIPSLPEEGEQLSFRTILLSWEFYLLILLAAFLRLYRLSATEFDADQAMIFSMARYALHHGLLVATANFASIHILNPPGVIWLLMVPAALSGNPLGAALLVALLAVAAVILTYLFTRRYYGRLAAVIVALLYATTSRAVDYARFSWNQNLLPLFLMLFMFSLYWGVVERRKGWLILALPLLGLLAQLHATGGMMIVAFIIALLLAPGTVRWWDIVLGICGLFCIYSTYFLWELTSHFQDLTILLHSTDNLRTQIDLQAWNYYQNLLSPYSEPYTATNTHLARIVPYLSWLHLRELLTCLLVGGLLFSLLTAVLPTAKGETFSMASPLSLWRPMQNWWRDLQAAPWRCGLLLLLAWQLTPLLAMTQHKLNLLPHYFIIVMPGQSIIIGLFLARIARSFQHSQQRIPALAGALIPCLLAIVIISAQTIATTANVFDAGLRHNSNGLTSNYHNALNPLQHAMREADTIAQQHHLNHVYVSADHINMQALSYLSAFMHTPTTVFEGSNCLILPGAATGPSILLVSPYNTLAIKLASAIAQAELLDRPGRPGGTPFHLYLIGASSQTTTNQQAFFGDLQLLQPSYLSAGPQSWLISNWQLRRTMHPKDFVTATYKMQEVDGGHQQCSFTSVRSGDHLLFAFQQATSPASLAFTGQFFTTQPTIFSKGPFAFLTGAEHNTSRITLRTVQGKSTITIQPPPGSLLPTIKTLLL